MSEKRVFIGTSGWTYDDWAGVFYPKEVKSADRLTYYASRFDTVEVNATFYRLPTEAMISAWNRKLGPNFHLVVKGSRVVTHLKKIGDCQGPLQGFLERALRLERLQAILWQLPPSLHKDTDRLDRFLALLPRNVKHAIEFRHRSWWDRDVVETLARHHAAFVAISHPRLPDALYATADFLYVRFHGLGSELYRYDYDREELEEWASMLRPHLSDRTLYVYFNNDYHAHSVRNALVLRELLINSCS